MLADRDSRFRNHVICGPGLWGGCNSINLIGREFITLIGADRLGHDSPICKNRGLVPGRPTYHRGGLVSTVLARADEVIG
jgi:hypothetical protein